MENYFAKNFRFLRKAAKISLIDLAKIINKGKSVVGNYENGITEPTIDTIFEISNYFGISAGDLLTKDLTPSKTSVNLLANATKDKAANLEQKSHIEYIPIHVDNHGNENIIFVELKSAAGFGAIVNNEKALAQYPSIALPGFLYRGRKQYVAFEIDGDSMHPTIQHRDIIIGSRIEKLLDIINGYVYTVVNEGAINTKRLHYIKGDHFVECYSDNDKVYEMFRIPINEITAIYKGEGLVRTQFRNWNNDLRRDIQGIKKDIMIIKSRTGIKLSKS